MRLTHKEGRIEIRLTLKDEEAAEFRWYMKKIGAKYNVATLRAALARAYEYERIKLEAIAPHLDANPT